MLVEQYPVNKRRGAFDLYAVPLLQAAAIIWTFVALFQALTSDYSDFTLFWDSSRAWLLGDDPYLEVPFRPGAGSNLNAPASVLVFVPLAYLPVRAALAVWLALTIGCITLASRMIARAIGHPARWTVVSAVVLVSQTTVSNIRLGQLGGPLLLLITHAWLAERSRRPLRAGPLLGISIYAKPFFGVFLPYLLARRSWRQLSAMTATWLVLTFIGVVTVGVSGYRSWFAVLTGVSWVSHIANASLLGFISRISTIPPPHIPLTPLVVRPDWVWPIWMICALFMTGLAAYCVYRGHRDLDREWAIVLLLSFLLSPLGWNYYVMVAAGPVMATLIGQRRQVRLIGVLGCLLLALPASMLIPHRLTALETMTLGSSYFWGVFLLFVAVGMAKVERVVSR